jgi:hypothetical protein
VEARATDLRLFAKEVPQGTYRVQGGAYLHLADRRLSMLIGFRWADGSGFRDAVGMEHLYHAMLGAMITVASACAHVAGAAAVAELSNPLAWEGWLEPDNDLAVTDVVSSPKPWRLRHSGVWVQRVSLPAADARHSTYLFAV